MTKRRWLLAVAYVCLSVAAIAEFWSVATGPQFATHRFQYVAHLVGAVALFGLSIGGLVALLVRRRRD